MPLPIPKAQTERSPADELRDWIAEAEGAIVAMRTDAAAAAKLIALGDRIDERMRELKAGRIDLRPEETRIESLRRRMLREAQRIVRQLRASGQEATFAESPTWLLVREAADTQRRQRIRQYATLGGVVGTLFLVFFVLLPWLFPAPPFANITAVERLFEEGQVEQALAQAQAEAQRAPNDPDIWLWIGAIHQSQGREAEAETAWATARSLTDEADFHSSRGIIFLQVWNYAGAEADARELIEGREFAANGYYLLGQTQAAQNKLPEALDSFQRTLAIAEAEDNATLIIAAKLEMQNLLQRVPVGPITPTP